MNIENNLGMFHSGGVAWCALFRTKTCMQRESFFQFYLTPLLIDKNMHRDYIDNVTL